MKILDCTLRDGAHINAGKFGEKNIKAIIKGLINAKIDIIELGFYKMDFLTRIILFLKVLIRRMSF